MDASLMLGLSTGHYTIIRGEELTDDYGDTYVTDVPLYVGVQGSVIEKKRDVYNPEDGRIDTVRMMTGRFAGNTDILDGDRIKDEKTGKVYGVSAVYHSNGIGMQSDLVLDLTS